MIGLLGVGILIIVCLYVIAIKLDRIGDCLTEVNIWLEQINKNIYNE